MTFLAWIGGLTAAILAVQAWVRSKRLAEEQSRIATRLIDLGDRIRALEAALARQRDTAAPAPPPVAASAAPPAPVRAPEPVAATLPPAMVPPRRAPVTPADRPPAPGRAGEPAPAPPPPVPPAPAAQGPFMRWLVGGNPLAKLGVILMFFGLAYLLHFANERGLLPIELRLAGAAAIAMMLLAVGWRLRTRNPAYGLTLQGGSVGALYLASFAAFRVYALLPHSVVFSLLVVICAACVALAVLQRSQGLAALASLGGFLAPVLLSTGEGNHVALFSYYAVLSGGILAIRFRQPWRLVTVVGFVFTFGVGAAWVVARYDPSLYATSQFFLALNLLIYGVLAALASIGHVRPGTEAVLDGTLVFGAPILGFGLQVGLTNHWEYGPAFSALAFGAVYLPLAWFTLRRWPERARRLTISFLAIGGGFMTLAIPLALSARWTAMAWALEGLGVLWAGRAQRSSRMTWSGTGLIVLAAGSASLAWLQGLDTATFLMVASTTSIVWLAAAWMWSREGRFGDFVSTLLLAGGVSGWLILLVDGSSRLVEPDSQAIMLALGAMSVTAVAWCAIASRAKWPALGESAYVLWPFALLALAGHTIVSGHPSADGWWSVAWLAAFAAAWYALGWGRAGPVPIWRAAEHAVFSWIAFGVVFVEARWRLDRLPWAHDEWEAAGLLALSGGAVLTMLALARRQHWTIASFPRAWWLWALVPPLVPALVLLARANLFDGIVPEWPYVPILNPLELSVAFVLLMGEAWRRRVATSVAPAVAGPAHALLVAVLVWWINGVLLRSLSRAGGVAWDAEALWQSAFVQTSMAIAWTIAALVCMALAACRANREAWFLGAAALAVVVVKLFLVDSARGGGLARAVAFIGVAVLVLVIGYLAPLPPRAGPKEEASS